MRARFVLVSSALALGVSLVCVPGPALAWVQDDPVDRAIAQYQGVMDAAGERGMFNAIQASQHAARAAIAGIDFDTLTADQIGRLAEAGVFEYIPGERQHISRLRTLMRVESAEGAHAALIHARAMVDVWAAQDGGDRQIARALRVYLDHAQADSTVNLPAASALADHLVEQADFWENLRAGMAANAERLLGFANTYVAEADADALGRVSSVLKVLEIAGIEGEELKRVSLSATVRLREEIDAADGVQRDRLESALYGLESQTRLAGLIGSPMPPMTIRWSSNDSVTSMRDYRGKVVVLDFWATWCGPCIMSFPRIEELRQRYEGYDVVIVGVTSLQGTHYPKESGPINVQGDPDREFALMTEFMQEHAMSWDVVFTEQDVFNADFGVRGIPHVAIIDPEGNVRYNALHPMDNDKAEKIDALLEEAGLDTPAG